MLNGPFTGERFYVRRNNYKSGALLALKTTGLKFQIKYSGERTNEMSVIQ